MNLRTIELLLCMGFTQIDTVTVIMTISMELVIYKNSNHSMCLYLEV